MTPPFETIRVRGGRTPFLARHAARLRRAGADPGDLAAILAPYRGGEDLVVRVEADAGGLAVTTRAVPPGGPLQVVVATTPHLPYPHKTTSRSAFAAAAAEARAAGADDALLLTAEGTVAEGTVWSLFWWEPEGLATPALSLGILPGIGRERIGEIVPATERAVRVDALSGRSLFATNAVRGVIEIATLNGEAVPRDARTASLAARFWP